MVDLFLKGGPLMYPLAACSLIALAIMIEKTVQFWLARSDRPLAEAVIKAADTRDWVKAESLAKGYDKPIGRLLAAALAGMHLREPTSRIGSRASALSS